VICACAKEVTMTSPKQDCSFHIRGDETEDFKQKSNDIFGSLDKIEARHNAHVNARIKFGRESEDKYMKKDPDDFIPVPRSKPGTGRPAWMQNPRAEVSCDIDTGHYNNQNIQQTSTDINKFQAPKQCAPKRKHTPDYRLHPEKYTMYSLGDVPKDNLTEASNTNAALEFLRQKREEKYETELSKCQNNQEASTSGESVTFEMDTSEKIEFKKPVDKNVLSESKGRYAGGKLCMPEYVVGQKKDKACVRQRSDIASGQVIGLGHLDEENIMGDEEQNSNNTAVSLQSASSFNISSDISDEQNQTKIDNSNEEATSTKVSFKKFKKHTKHMRQRIDAEVDED